MYESFFNNCVVFCTLNTVYRVTQINSLMTWWSYTFSDPGLIMRPHWSFWFFSGLFLLLFLSSLLWTTTTLPLWWFTTKCIVIVLFLVFRQVIFGILFKLVPLVLELDDPGRVLTFVGNFFLKTPGIGVHTNSRKITNPNRISQRIQMISYWLHPPSTLLELEIVNGLLNNNVYACGSFSVLFKLMIDVCWEHTERSVMPATDRVNQGRLIKLTTSHYLTPSYIHITFKLYVITIRHNITLLTRLCLCTPT